MFPAKRSSIASFWVVIAVVILPSCSALDLFKDAPSQAQTVPLASPAKEADITGATEKEDGIESLEAKIVLLENKVKTLESQVAGQKKVVYTIEYSDPAQLYKKARTLLLAKDIDNAADLFLTFAEQHPDHGLADNALYWLGECHYTTGRYKQAVDVFQVLVKTYPKAEKVPDALLKTGYAYISLDDITRADHYLKLVIKKHPFSRAAEKAQIRLKEFQ